MKDVFSNMEPIQKTGWWAAYWPALLCLTGITILSVLPNVQLPKFELVASDKLGHAVAYGTLTWLALRGLRRSTGRMTSAGAWMTLLFAIAYGVLMEFVQYAFVPGRFYEYDDMIANAFGALVAWSIFMARLRRKQLRQKAASP